MLTKSTYNHEISPIYRYISNIDRVGIPFGAGKGNRTPVLSLEN